MPPMPLLESKSTAVVAPASNLTPAIFNACYVSTTSDPIHLPDSTPYILIWYMDVIDTEVIGQFLHSALCTTHCFFILVAPQDRIDAMSAEDRECFRQLYEGRGTCRLYNLSSSVDIIVDLAQFLVRSSAVRFVCIKAPHEAINNWRTAMRVAAGEEEIEDSPARAFHPVVAAWNTAVYSRWAPASRAEQRSIQRMVQCQTPVLVERALTEVESLSGSKDRHMAAAIRDLLRSCDDEEASAGLAVAELARRLMEPQAFIQRALSDFEGKWFEVCPATSDPGPSNAVVSWRLVDPNRKSVVKGVSTPRATPAFVAGIVNDSARIPPSPVPTPTARPSTPPTLRSASSGRTNSTSTGGSETTPREYPGEYPVHHHHRHQTNSRSPEPKGKDPVSGNDSGLKLHRTQSMRVRDEQIEPLVTPRFEPGNPPSYGPTSAQEPTMSEPDNWLPPKIYFTTMPPQPSHHHHQYPADPSAYPSIMGQTARPTAGASGNLLNPDVIRAAENVFVEEGIDPRQPCELFGPQFEMALSRHVASGNTRRATQLQAAYGLIIAQHADNEGPTHQNPFAPTPQFQPPQCLHNCQYGACPNVPRPIPAGVPGGSYSGVQPQMGSQPYPGAPFFNGLGPVGYPQTQFQVPPLNLSGTRSQYVVPPPTFHHHYQQPSWGPCQCSCGGSCCASSHSESLTSCECSHPPDSLTSSLPALPNICPLCHRPRSGPPSSSNKIPVYRGVHTYERLREISARLNATTGDGRQSVESTPTKRSPCHHHHHHHHRQAENSAHNIDIRNDPRRGSAPIAIPPRRAAAELHQHPKIVEESPQLRPVFSPATSSMVELQLDPANGPMTSDSTPAGMGGQRWSFSSLKSGSVSANGEVTPGPLPAAPRLSPTPPPLPVSSLPSVMLHAGGYPEGIIAMKPQPSIDCVSTYSHTPSISSASSSPVCPSCDDNGDPTIEILMA